MNFLHKYKITPKIIAKKKNKFEEEYITQLNIAKKLNEKEIISLAKLLTTLHKIKIPKTIYKFFCLKEKNFHYKPSQILQLMLNGKNNIPLPKPFCKKIGNKLKKDDIYFLNKNINIGLIHGDLSRNNILIARNKKILLTDWTDCRIDATSCDVAQLYYLCEFKSEQIRIFEENYSGGYIDKKIIATHLLLIYIYELVNIYKKSNTINLCKIQKIRELINKD